METIKLQWHSRYVLPKGVASPVLLHVEIPAGVVPRPAEVVISPAKGVGSEKFRAKLSGEPDGAPLLPSAYGENYMGKPPNPPVNSARLRFFVGKVDKSGQFPTRNAGESVYVTLTAEDGVIDAGTGLDVNENAPFK